MLFPHVYEQKFIYYYSYVFLSPLEKNKNVKIIELLGFIAKKTFSGTNPSAGLSLTYVFVVFGRI